MILAIVRVFVLLLHVNGAAAAFLSDRRDFSIQAEQLNQRECDRYRDQDVVDNCVVVWFFGCKGQK